MVVAEPLQSLPPFEGDGLLQERVPVRVPLPQVTGQPPNVHALQPPLTGQALLVPQLSVIVSEPAQAFPPFAGAGLVQERVPVRVPPLPQVTEQLEKDQALHTPSTAQAVLVPQVSVLKSEPAQAFPPFEGAGLVQVRVLVRVPPLPQETEQLETVQALHTPLTGQAVLVPQVSVLVSEPAQALPPFAGAGLVQERVPVRVPPLPQVTEQLEKDQALHMPLMGGATNAE